MVIFIVNKFYRLLSHTWRRQWSANALSLLIFHYKSSNSSPNHKEFEKETINSIPAWSESRVHSTFLLVHLQIFGGNGFNSDYPVEKLMRDAKIFQVSIVFCRKFHWSIFIWKRPWYLSWYCSSLSIFHKVIFCSRHILIY